MRKPKMIIFDAGRTLIDSAETDTQKAVQMLVPYISNNPKCLSPAQIDSYVKEVVSHFESARKNLVEVPVKTMLKLAYGLMNLKFAISLEEIERIIWMNDSIVEPVEQAQELISALNDLDIRTAVISNLDFSGYLLKERFDSLFPENRFEFVIASSDYCVRKPSALLFEIGIEISGLLPEEIWYVGDKVCTDVEGSRKCGMMPVLYKNKHNAYDSIPERILSIDEHMQIIDILKQCDA